MRVLYLRAKLDRGRVWRWLTEAALGGGWGCLLAGSPHYAIAPCCRLLWRRGTLN